MLADINATSNSLKALSLNSLVVQRYLTVWSKHWRLLQLLETGKSCQEKKLSLVGPASTPNVTLV
jgi:hypothetical protein